MKRTTKRLLVELAAMALVLGVSFFLVIVLGGLTAIICEAIILAVWVLGEKSGTYTEQIRSGEDTVYFFAKSAQNRGQALDLETVAWLKEQDRKTHRLKPIEYPGPAGSPLAD
jgi:hypothetical protein